MDSYKSMVRAKQQKHSVMKQLLTVLILCCGQMVYGENDLALINDSDGFVNVRTGPGIDFPVIATINEKEFFYCGWDQDAEWIPMIALRWKDRQQVEGFMHKTRIKRVKDMGTADQKALLRGVLQQQRTKAEEFLKAWESKDSSAYARSVRCLEDHSETQYEPILGGSLQKYICATKDTIMLNLFYSTVWAHRGSASELPSFALGGCFVCEADMVIRHVNRRRSKEERELLFDNIEFGLLNLTDVEEDGTPKDARYIQLKKKLDRARTSS